MQENSLTKYGLEFKGIFLFHRLFFNLNFLSVYTLIVRTLSVSINLNGLSLRKFEPS